MLILKTGDKEFFDSSTNQFVNVEGTTIRFEYSLKALYDWESRWQKPFLKGGVEDNELLDFYRAMAIDPIIDDHLTTDVQNALAKYIQSSQTATVFSESKSSGKKTKPKIYSAEEIYALMFSAGVDIAFENRNLNRLLVILRIIGSYNEPPKKMAKEEVMRQNKSLNEQRKALYQTKG